MAAELGDLEAAKAKLRELRRERERLVDLARTEGALPTIEELEPLVQAKLGDLKATLRADVGLDADILGVSGGSHRPITAHGPALRLPVSWPLAA